MSLEQRVTDLECQLSFQDDTIETLNQSIIQQQNRIDELVHQLSKLNAELKAFQQASDGDSPPVDERPPHY